MDNAVALAAIALAATSVGGLIWLAKFVARTLGADLREHTKAALKQVEASRESSKDSKASIQASQEVLTFMKSLNGKLGKITHQTIQEQNVTHQTVEHEEQK
jgi:hypothetical protein